MWFTENYDNKASLGLAVKEKLHEEQSPFQKIAFWKTEFFGTLLTLDGLVMCSEKDEFIYHEMIVHMSLCTHPKPERVLVIGGGDGGAIREILKHDSVKEAVLCEIDERVVRLSQQFMPSTASQLTDERVTLAFEDGFEFLKKFENHFDVIITDSSDPIGPGVALFQEEYYKLVKGALRSGGIMVSQSESPWFYADVMKNMTGAMCNVFSNIETYIAMIPLYPSGLWTMTMASDTHSLSDFDFDRAEKIATQCKYYNPGIHLGSLELPNFVKDIVKNR